MFDYEISSGNLSMLRRNWLRRESSMMKTAQELPAFIPYFSELEDHDVIEIGPGQNPVCRFFRCKSYKGVQPFVSRGELGGDYLLTDGLSYLKTEPDNSAVVCMVGLDDFVLGNFGSNLHQAYVFQLAREIRRVSHPFAIVLGGDAKTWLGTADIGLELSDRWGGVYLFD